jgi:hypothetical protein
MRNPACSTALLLAGLSAVFAAPAESAKTNSSPPAPVPTVASIPAAVQPFVAQIEQVPVSSERYSEAMQAGGTITTKSRNGGRHTVTRHISKLSFGEASLASHRGKVFRHGSSGPPRTIAIGSTLYIYTPSVAHKDGGRPWVRLNGSGVASLFPFHGHTVPQLEVDAGGTGAYAELIDLLATAGGNVAVVGPATVDGQPTTELTAAVKPLALVKGASVRDTEELPAVLKVFVGESGLPVRVTRSEQFGTIAVTETIDVLAVNVPVVAKAPPARKTIGLKKFVKLLSGKKGGPDREGGTGFKLVS